MTSLSRILLLWGVAASAAGAGQVAGTVVSAQGGEPLASVELTLSPVGSAADRRRPGPLRFINAASTRTTLDGRFVFQDVEPGEYIVGAAKSGYEGGGRTAHRVTLADSEPSAGVSIEMRRSAAIEGRVVDRDGDPLPGARIELRAWTMADGRRMLRGMRSAETDDRGLYRISNVAPGSYLAYLHPSTLNMRQGGMLYESAGVYYPHGSTPAEAAKVDLGWDMDLQGVDFVAPPPGGVLASGMVSREDGTPCPECWIVVLDSDGQTVVGTRLADTARFAIHGLPAGEYTIVARGPRGSGSAVEKLYLPDGRPVEIALRLAPAQSVSGFISTEKVEEGAEIAIERAVIRLLPADPSGGGQPMGSRVEADGRFEIAQVPQGLYRPVVFGLPGNGYISRIRHGGGTLPASGLRVTADGPVSGLELVASFDGGAVQGPVVTAEGELAATEGFAILLPLRTTAALNMPIMTGYRGEGGVVRFNGVAPGEYLLFSTSRNFIADWSDPATMARLRRRATVVEVRPGETAEADAPYLETP